jgi:hypothetical protein
MSSEGKSTNFLASNPDGRVLVGCPVYERGWILDRWFAALKAWPVQLDFVFAYTPGSDDTLDIIQGESSAHIILAEEGDHSVERNWGQRSRIETLADMRNALLGYARRMGPAYYLSLDSDVLVAPWEESQRLFDTEFDAVSPLVYLGAGDVANAFHWRGDHVTRLGAKQRYGVPQTADVLCAAILMSPTAYNVGTYEYDLLGEDIAWARTVRHEPISLGFDSSVIFWHVMSKEDLHVNDPRVSWSS